VIKLLRLIECPWDGRMLEHLEQQCTGCPLGSVGAEPNESTGWLSCSCWRLRLGGTISFSRTRSIGLCNIVLELISWKVKNLLTENEGCLIEVGTSFL
jgi:hypothetical protein